MPRRIVPPERSATVPSVWTEVSCTTATIQTGSGDRLPFTTDRKLQAVRHWFGRPDGLRRFLRDDHRGSSGSNRTKTSFNHRDTSVVRGPQAGRIGFELAYLYGRCSVPIETSAMTVPHMHRWASCTRGGGRPMWFAEAPCKECPIPVQRPFSQSETSLCSANIRQSKAPLAIAGGSVMESQSRRVHARRLWWAVPFVAPSRSQFRCTNGGRVRDDCSLAWSPPGPSGHNPTDRAAQRLGHLRVHSFPPHPLTHQGGNTPPTSMATTTALKWASPRRSKQAFPRISVWRRPRGQPARLRAPRDAVSSG